jgi:anaerobic ribonucleoside-triphosphate reductase activating protein
MIKYCNSSIVFGEIPDEISLCLFISNCQNNCQGCHSSFLQKDIGDILDNNVLDELIKKNKGISCVLFMGEGNNVNNLIGLAKYVKERYLLKVALYSGRDTVEEYFYSFWDYLKIGHYDKSFGPLNCSSTNQKMFQITYKNITDITKRFLTSP